MFYSVDSALQLLWEYKAQYSQGERPPSECHSICPTGLSKLMDSARKGLYLTVQSLSDRYNDPS